MIESNKPMSYKNGVSTPATPAPATPPASVPVFVGSTNWVAALRDYTKTLTDERRLALWAEITEGFCTDCGRTLRHNEVCHCTNDE